MNLLRFSPGAGQRGTEVVRIIIDFLARSWQDRTTPMEKEAAFPNDAPSGWGGTQM